MTGVNGDSLSLFVFIDSLQLKARITEMESASMAEKPWQLMGEVTGGVRPENSLLEEHVDFEHTTRLRKFSHELHF